VLLPGAHYGLNSDIAPCPKSAKERTRCFPLDSCKRTSRRRFIPSWADHLPPRQRLLGNQFGAGGVTMGNGFGPGGIAPKSRSAVLFTGVHCLTRNSRNETVGSGAAMFFPTPPRYRQDRPDSSCDPHSRASRRARAGRRAAAEERLNTMGACSHSITPAVQTLNFGCGENCQYETAASQWLASSNSSSSNRRTHGVYATG
jgi:hypothetical protein